MTRVNRFRVTVTVKGTTVDAHLPNSGRLTELLTPDRRCWLAGMKAPHRKTDYDLKLVEYAGVLVSVDARLPNPLLAEALQGRQLDAFQRCRGFDQEVPLGKSRVDFRLTTPKGPLWIEAKSVTLVEHGVALFPDAPTARGTRHLHELVTAVGEGEQAAVVFVIQRPDAQRFRPHDKADPAFGEALRLAASSGVDIHAWTCQVSTEAIIIAERVPVILA